MFQICTIMKKVDPESANDGWSKMSVRRKVKDEIDNFIGSSLAEKNGLTNATQFLDVALREALQKYQKTRFEHFNFAENVIRLIDNDRPAGTPYVEIALKSEKLYCRVCESVNCIHIEESWSNPEISKQLKRKNVKKSV